MAMEFLEKRSWHAYFDALSSILEGKEAHIDADTLDSERQVEAQFLPLLGIGYDTRNDILEVLVDGFDHSIASGREIYVDHDGMNLNSVRVLDADGVQHIIRLRDRALLPASPSSAVFAGC